MTEQIWSKEEQKEHRKLWIEALRSHTYIQTISCLHNRGGYCCLGVACDVAIKNGVALDFKEDFATGIYLYDDTYDILPEKVRKYMGLATVSGLFEDQHEAYNIDSTSPTSLILCNDEYYLTFDQIADIIEQQYKEI